MLVTVTVQTFFTLNPNTRRIARGIQLYGVTYFMVVSFLPLPLLLVSTALLPRKTRVEKFGTGRFRTKIAVLATASFLLCLGASYKAAIVYQTPVPRSRPMPAHLHKACFYIFNFVVEVLVVYLYALLRIDRRFHVPNGAKGPGSYAVGQVDGAADAVATKEKPKHAEQPRSLVGVYSEEETFDNEPQKGEADNVSPTDSKDMEAGFTPIRTEAGPDWKSASGAQERSAST